jgi:hypothetical protein
MVKRMNKRELFEFMIDIVCLNDNSKKLEKLKVMCYGNFNLNVTVATWMSFCRNNCYNNHVELFSMVHHLITYNHSHPDKLWSNFLAELNKIKTDNI